MVFPQPDYSNSAVDRAGDILISRKSNDQEQFNHALDVLSNWRACHGYPMNTFQATLRTRLRRLKSNAIVAQRLKRMSTIIDKLRRFRGMKLARMQDIGGLRAVVKSIKDVTQLESIYLMDKKFQHRLVRTDDYIQNPKEDGYRSVHLVYRYKNKIKPEYNGLLLELQIRTKLQHAWATAVETMGTYLGQALKSGEGEKKWRDFFAITSSAFAYIEGTPRISKYNKMDKKETFDAVAHIAEDIRALNAMESYKFALKIIADKKGKGSYYHLIILNSLEKKVRITSYAKDNIKKASEDYTEAEARVANGEKIEPVLVSAGDINSLKRAYPNFFLDVQDFIVRVAAIIEKSKKMPSN